MRSVFLAAAALALSPGAVLGVSLISANYFSQPAYVMQAVSDRAEIYAAPLDGIAELGFYPALDAGQLEELEWSVTANDPSLIGVAIENSTLFIWGADANTSGSGSVELSVSSASGETDSVTIPVTVFRDDKTLISGEGKKDYFIPWSPDLDISRIISVEEHMRTYQKEDVSLDRTIQWSRWKRAERMNDATKSVFWMNELVSRGAWSRRAQLSLVSAMLSEMKAIGINAIRIENPFYIWGDAGVEIKAVYDHWTAGPTMRPDEFDYFVNEAHRLGLDVIPSIWLAVDSRSIGGAYHEIWQADPADPPQFWDNYEQFMLDQMKHWAELGVDIAAVGNCIEFIGPESDANRELTDRRLSQLADRSRSTYSGPITHFCGVRYWFGSDRFIDEADFWGHVDILSMGIEKPDGMPLAEGSDPSLAVLIMGWERRIASYFAPFQARYDKPFLAYENGCYSVDGSVVWGAYFPEFGSPPFRVDSTDMLDYIDSQMQAFEDMEGYIGPGLYRYHFDPNWLGGVNDWRLTPRLKTDELLRAAFAPSRPSEPIIVDGITTDWSGMSPRTSDPMGDQKAGGDDLTALWAATGTDHLYLRVDYVAAPQGNLRIWITTEPDTGEAFYISATRVSQPILGQTPHMTWKAMLYSSENQKTAIGFADVAAAGQSLELRLHKEFIPQLLSCDRINLVAHCGDGPADETPWCNLRPRDQ